MGILDKRFEEEGATDAEVKAPQKAEATVTTTTTTKVDLGTAKDAAKAPDLQMAGDAAAANTAVATVAAAAMVVARPRKVVHGAFEDLKDTLHVDYNTLTQVFPSNGNFMDRETNDNLGDSIVFLVKSYQDSFVVSPEDDNAPDEVVRYSDDGVICSDGTPVQAHLEYLQANGYPKAKVKNRNVVVAELLEVPKLPRYVGELVQIDLPPSSKVMWDRYRVNALYAVQTKRKTEDEIGVVKGTANVTRKGDNVFTLAKFETAVRPVVA